MMKLTVTVPVARLFNSDELGFIESFVKSAVDEYFHKDAEADAEARVRGNSAHAPVGLLRQR